MAIVSLIPMTSERYLAWRAGAVASYADENVKSGHWEPDQAQSLSEAQFSELLPHGPDTPGQWLWSIVAESGNEVGILWVARDRQGRAFIYDIEMNPAYRGEGYGTAALLALEDWCRANGFGSIGLHVFGHNDGAWRLYKRLGYIETSVQMEKRL
ncbi:MAG: GNAT family N-acetyltransferase [Chloroflexota bacterium]